MVSPRFLFLAFVMCALAASTFAVVAPNPDETIFLERGRQAALALGKALRGKLQETFSAQGPISAIDVCHIEANGIAASVSEEVGASVGRTALRVRNPSNSPDDRARKVLEDFTRRAAEGAPISDLEHLEIVDRADGQREVRYWKAIPTEAMCAACHGESIAPEIDAAILERYPRDEARGFRIGDVRGAFDIRWIQPATP